LPNEIITYLLR